jgi:hypothetical protein
LDFSNNLNSLTDVVYTYETYKKDKYHPRTGHAGPDGEKFSFTLSLTSALDGTCGKLNVPAALTPGKRSDTHFTGLGGPQGQY